MLGEIAGVVQRYKNIDPIACLSQNELVQSVSVDSQVSRFQDQIKSEVHMTSIT